MERNGNFYVDKPDYRNKNPKHNIGKIENYKSFGKAFVDLLNTYGKEGIEMAPDIVFEVALDYLEDSGIEIDNPLDCYYTVDYIREPQHFKYPDPEQQIIPEVVAKKLVYLEQIVTPSDPNSKYINPISIGWDFVTGIFLNPKCYYTPSN